MLRVLKERADAIAKVVLADVICNGRGSRGKGGGRRRMGRQRQQSALCHRKGLTRNETCDRLEGLRRARHGGRLQARALGRDRPAPPRPAGHLGARRDLFADLSVHAVYHRSEKGGGAWEYRKKMPAEWEIGYKDLRFKVKPMGFKHTGLFPEQAVNWERMRALIEGAGRPIKVLNLFAYTGGGERRLRQGGGAGHARRRGERHGRARGARTRGSRGSRAASAISWTTARSSCSGSSGAATATTRSSWTRPPTGGGRRRAVEDRGEPLPLRAALRRSALGAAAVFSHQQLHHGPAARGARQYPDAVHARGRQRRRIRSRAADGGGDLPSLRRREGMCTWTN